MRVTDEQLKPCPFCGGEAEIWRASGRKTSWVACMGRCATLVSKEHTTDAEAIAAWNRRAALAVEGTPKVKALEWLESRRPVKTYWAQDERGDLYWINQAFGSDSYYFTTVRRSDGATLYDGDDLGSAKAAAQADYEKRVLSCLEYTTPPAGIREALEAAGDAMDEYYRYWTGGESRGSYDGKPERQRLWAAMHTVKAARAALRGQS